MMKSFIFLPTPSSLTYMWNMGSLLGVVLLLQIASGFFLSMHYNSSMFLAFDSIIHMMNDVNHGWMLRLVHANGASLLFILLYLHIMRGFIYKSFRLWKVWIMGVLILFLFMGVSFMGYILPWGQMSFWGATVITNLVSAIPYVGVDLVLWIWGGFSVSGPTLSRFFSFHFLFPLLGVVLVLSHLMFLHETGSSNPLGLMENSDKIVFHPFFTIKDILGMMVMMILLLISILIKPYIFMDPDNFMEANPLSTPEHIQPEWYFLFAYSILRSVPNKLGGVLMLIMSILIFAVFPLMNSGKMYKMYFYTILSCMFFSSFLLLTWAGSLPVEYPYTIISQCLTGFYFSVNMLMMMT